MNSSERIDNVLREGNHYESNQCYGLECLSQSDITVEGVDFHVSSVLNSAVLSNTTLVQECYNQLEHMTLPARFHPMSPTNGDQRHERLEGLLKSCMWKYSAGVNLRLPLIPLVTEDSCKGGDDTDLTRFWKEMIQPKTKAFSTRYVAERISK
jgi:hypothetical protein